MSAKHDKINKALYDAIRRNAESMPKSQAITRALRDLKIGRKTAIVSRTISAAIR